MIFTEHSCRYPARNLFQRPTCLKDHFSWIHPGTIENHKGLSNSKKQVQIYLDIKYISYKSWKKLSKNIYIYPVVFQKCFAAIAEIIFSHRIFGLLFTLVFLLYLGWFLPCHWVFIKSLILIQQRFFSKVKIVKLSNDVENFHFRFSQNTSMKHLLYFSAI